MTVTPQCLIQCGVVKFFSRILRNFDATVTNVTVIRDYTHNTGLVGNTGLPSLNTNHKQRIHFGFPHLLSSGSGYAYHRLFTMQRRFFLNSELVIRRLLRSVVSKPKRSSISILREEDFATSNVGAGIRERIYLS